MAASHANAQGAEVTNLEQMLDRIGDAAEDRDDVSLGALVLSRSDVALITET